MARPTTVNVRLVKAAWFKRSLTAVLVGELARTSAAHVKLIWSRLKVTGELPPVRRTEYFKANPEIDDAAAAALDELIEAAAEAPPDPDEWVEIGCAIPAGDPLLAALRASPEGQSERRQHDDMTVALARAGKKEKA